jgi:AraC-like DNA-binding protein
MVLPQPWVVRRCPLLRISVRRAVDDLSMSIDDLPDLALPDLGRVEDSARPILSFAWHSGGPHRAAAHHHPRAHIIEVLVGSMWAATPEGSWLVPTGQAIWIPPRVFHSVYSHGAASARMLFVDETCAVDLPTRAGTVTVSPLLGQLAARALEHGNDYLRDGPMTRLSAVVLDELAAMATAPLLVPISSEPRLAAVMQRLIDDPGCEHPLGQLASAAGAGERTIARLFATETGMSFSQWRTRLRLVESIERLNNGATVTEVAAELGYSSPAAFTHMFRSNLGSLPSAHQHQTRQGTGTGGGA